MWYRRFRDYPIDTSLKKEKVESGNGLTGCEMHEQNGWGELHHHKQTKEQRTFFRSLLKGIFHKFE